MLEHNDWCLNISKIEAVMKPGKEPEWVENKYTIALLKHMIYADRETQVPHLFRQDGQNS